LQQFVYFNQHWYKLDGNPAYSVVGANGNERPTTLRDARKGGLVPSVTTIMGCADKPGLTNWKIDQAILAALTCPRIDGEDEAAYLSRIKQDAKEQARKAAERGTQIHAWVQEGFEQEGCVCEEGYPFWESANDILTFECGSQDWKPEASFATDLYGGKCDLHTAAWVIDFKSTDKDISTLKLWDEHYQQLAAYREGLKIPKAKCGILYISSVTAKSRLIVAPEEDLIKGIRCFNALCDYWYAKSGLKFKEAA